MKEECCNIGDIVQEFYTYLKAYVIKKVGDEHVAEDIVQDVMLKLVESHEKSTEIENIKAWLFQVSRNTIYDYYKKSRIELEVGESLEEDDDPFSKIVVSDYIIPMIKLLPTEYGRPLMLSDIDNIPQKDIAKHLGLGVSATKMRIQRGRKKLHNLFIECCNIEYDKNGNFIGCTIKNSCEPLHKISKEIKNKSL